MPPRQGFLRMAFLNSKPQGADRDDQFYPHDILVTRTIQNILLILSKNKPQGFKSSFNFSSRRGT
jgi:hypothetical protein